MQIEITRRAKGAKRGGFLPHESGSKLLDTCFVMSCRNAGPGFQSDCAATENVASGLRMRNPANSSGCETRWSCLKAWQEPAQYFLKHSITRQVHRMATLRARAHLDHGQDRGCPSPTLCNETRKTAQLHKFAKLTTQKLIVMTKKHRQSLVSLVVTTKNVKLELIVMILHDYLLLFNYCG